MRTRTEILERDIQNRIRLGDSDKEIAEYIRTYTASTEELVALIRFLMEKEELTKI